VASSRAAFGVAFDRSGSASRWSTERGVTIADDRALLVVMDLVAAERRTGRIALPVTTTRVAEAVAVSTGWRSPGRHGARQPGPSGDRSGV